MPVIEYTARRSLYADHVSSTKYRMPVCIRVADESVEAVSSIERSPGGGMEILLERLDHNWSLTFLARNGTELLALREMLDSTESGETFLLWLYDDPESSESPPTYLKRVDVGHTEMVLARRGGDGQRDMFTATIMATEAIVFDPVTLKALPGYSDAVDIYDPNVGGPDGGLDPVTNTPQGVTLTDHQLDLLVQHSGLGSSFAGVSFQFLRDTGRLRYVVGPYDLATGGLVYNEVQVTVDGVVVDSDFWDPSSGTGEGDAGLYYVEDEWYAGTMPDDLDLEMKCHIVSGGSPLPTSMPTPDTWVAFNDQISMGYASGLSVFTREAVVNVQIRDAATEEVLCDADLSLRVESHT